RSKCSGSPRDVPFVTPPRVFAQVSWLRPGLARSRTGGGLVRGYFGGEGRTRTRARVSVAALVGALVLSMLVMLPTPPARAAGVGDVDGGFGVHGTIEKDYGGIDIAQAAVVDAAGRIVTVGWSQDTPDHAIVGRTLPSAPGSNGTSEIGFR